MFLTTGEVTLAVGALTALSGVGGILLGGRVQSRRDRDQRTQELAQERKRWERDDAQERERWQREDSLRWSHERRDVYARYFTADREVYQVLTSHRLAVLTEQDPVAALKLDLHSPLIKEMTASLSDLSLIVSTEAHRSAEQLYTHTAAATDLAMRAHIFTPKPGTEEWQRDWTALQEEIELHGQLADAALAAAKKDLNVA